MTFEENKPVFFLISKLQVYSEEGEKISNVKLTDHISGIAVRIEMEESACIPVRAKGVVSELVADVCAETGRLHAGSLNASMHNDFVKAISFFNSLKS